ncbi:biopolymer transporter ExbD [Moraxella ovis]|uniref:Biopolymer transport protein exbD n=1 Tax=Moraxella ovis TaxID=29433 RepID=A0A160GG69_9GAMM|nr:biopolymer transporter ExbD [Moraxella ovis]ANB91432.1 biopolymer transporter ExbD [Moraxella ovis]SPX84610.1 Biopolymer transport protein exbD [Moraxella ovis]STY87037.1 Biopolymer transport protein exbD [Moraxella ovis]STZ05064.1 Biopolymer transport protein exbD [Moraxella ovis]
MAFELGNNEDNGMNEMNLIPLIDIMLVLMIIFLVTATVLNPTVPLDLPKTTASVNEQPPEVLQVSIDSQGDIFWDSEKIDLDELKTRFANQVAEGKDPQVQLRADREGKYDMVAQVLATASTTGLSKIAFVNE